jgi:hypothetical protein
MADSEDSRAKHRARVRKWRAAHLDIARARDREYKAANRDQINARQRERKNANREAHNAKRRAWAAGNPRYSYLEHRHHAREREVPFLLTFKEWWAIWQESGYWNQRGINKGQYVMARLGDLGPYAVGNVRIGTTGENVREALIVRPRVFASAETRKLMSEAQKKRWAMRHQTISAQRPA